MITNVDLPNAAKWSVILPIKGGSEAKSRLGSHPRSIYLAHEFAEKTLVALLACPEVGNVIIVAGDERWANLRSERITGISDPGGGLNAAIRAARDYKNENRENQLVGVVPSDLALLDPTDLAKVLKEARLHPRTFVRDKDGDGTTLLTALKRSELVPLYGESSALAHLNSGAIELRAPHSVRFDVDTLADLELFDLEQITKGPPVRRPLRNS